ncbi:MAG: TetR/AcrR family transcriptional regulator [Pseudobacteriovorax sp.]|nr:TetR/AcrR family transcriptional regulator [Pseudobacteriovorax sp.]
MNQRQKQKEATRSKIMETSRELFREFGFEVTTRNIAESSGISVGTIFVHFKDKRDLLINVLHKDLEKAGLRSLKQLDPRKSVLTNLINVTKPIYAYYLSDPRLSQVLLKESLFVGEEYTNKLIKDQLETFLEIISKTISPHFGGSQDDVNNFMTTFFSLYFVNIIRHLKFKTTTVEAAIKDLEKSLIPLVRGYGVD